MQMISVITNKLEVLESTNNLWPYSTIVTLLCRCCSRSIANNHTIISPTLVDTYDSLGVSPTLVVARTPWVYVNIHWRCKWLNSQRLTHTYGASCTIPGVRLVRPVQYQPCIRCPSTVLSEEKKEPTRGRKKLWNVDRDQQLVWITT